VATNILTRLALAGCLAATAALPAAAQTDSATLQVSARVADRCNFSTAPLQLGGACLLASPYRAGLPRAEAATALDDCHVAGTCEPVGRTPAGRPVFSPGPHLVVVF
jgi:hypothetical protein